MLICILLCLSPVLSRYCFSSFSKCITGERFEMKGIDTSSGVEVDYNKLRNLESRRMEDAFHKFN